MDVRSLVSKLDYVKVWAQQTNTDIFVSSETLLSNIEDEDIAFDGYNVFRTDKEGFRKGGGISIYVKKCLSVTVVKSITRPKCSEYLALNVCLGNTANCENVFVIGAYCPPSAKSGAIEKLFKLISAHEKYEILLLGDLNLNFLSDVSNALKHLCNNLNLTINHCPNKA